MAIRQYDFLVSVETPNTPTVEDPTSGDGVVSSGYLDDRWYWGSSVASYVAMRALTSTQRRDNQIRNVDVAATPELWKFDAASTTADNGTTVLKPDDILIADPGRWHKLEASGGGGGGGGASGLEALINKLESERADVFTEPFDNSLGLSGRRVPQSRSVNGYLLESVTAGATALTVAWDPVFLNDSDKDVNTTTNWTVLNAGASLTATSTAGEFKVGTHALKFDKNNTNVLAGIFYDRGSINFSVGSNTSLLFWIFLPSITNLASVNTWLTQDGTNFRSWKTTVDANGNALAIGWNLIRFDLSSTTGSVTGGTGWEITQLARYVYVHVETTGASQTYTGIILDGPWFSRGNPATLGFNGQELTLFNTSTKENVTINASNTVFDGRLTLASAISNSYSNGFVSAALPRLRRFTLAAIGDDVFSMDNDAGLSGAITTAQEIRSGVMLHDTTSGTFTSFVDYFGPQIYTCLSVSGSTITIEDPADTSANLLNGDTVEIFRPLYSDAETRYTLFASRAMTANATHLSGITTLTLTTTGIQAGDLIVKRVVSTQAVSLQATNANESFVTATPLASPNGIRLLNYGTNYPNQDFVWGHWHIGGPTNSEAVRLRRGTSGLPLAVNGAPNLQSAFLGLGRFSGSAWTTSNFLSLTEAQSQPISGDPTDVSIMQMSFWLNVPATGAIRAVLDKFSGASGWEIRIPGSSATIAVQTNNTVRYTVGIPLATWFHVFWVSYGTGATTSKLYINGVAGSPFASPISGGTTGSMTVGTSGSGYGSDNFFLADLIVWRNGPEFTSAQVNAIYNGGVFKPVGLATACRYVGENTALSGQRLSAKYAISRSTTGVTHQFGKFGVIKTS